jgi:hypothetical protein
MALPDELKYPAPQPGQARATAGAQLAGPIESGIDAGAVVVIGDRPAPPCHGSFRQLRGTL